MRVVRVFSSYFVLFLFSFSGALWATELQLAHVYREQDITAYLVSEKYDGVRAIWRDGHLRTRSGNLIHAPSWFTQDLPDTWLDGELWIGRQGFQAVTSAVLKSEPVDEQWRQVRYMVFDAPGAGGPFSARARYYTQLIDAVNVDHLRAIDQHRFTSVDAFNHWYEDLLAQAAEGVMLHKADALFIPGRVDHLLKLKPYLDDEAIVLKYYPGQGKYKNKMGSMLVAWLDADGHYKEFKIGSGFTDAERENPPAIGVQVSFKYYALTNSGIPRFATYWRERRTP